MEQRDALCDLNAALSRFGFPEAVGEPAVFLHETYEDSLEKRIARGDLDGANALLRRMLADLTAPDDGSFARAGRASCEA